MGERDVAEVERLAQDGLGIDDLRPGQREAVEAVTAGRDVLAVMPTGYGKSAIYQLAGAAVDGPTVVVSPLIALQRDQVDALAEHDVGQAAQANSSIAASERRAALQRLVDGELEFLFVAPEQLARDDTKRALAEAAPSLFVVDEAHLISTWGHDFRPDYLRLGDVIEGLGHPTVVALTATAAPPVRTEIIERLRLREPAVVVHGFDRPNLHLVVETHEDEGQRDGRVLDRATSLAAGHRAGLVYVATRRRAESFADRLSRQGVRAAPYHAGLPTQRRDGVQESFMNDEVDVVVATNAFGMGIDKPDVRFVLHADMPDSLDAYYQEIGRAGRDGQEAEVCLFFRRADVGKRRFTSAAGAVPAKVVRSVLDAVEGSDGATTAEELAEESGVSARRLTRVLGRLEDVEAVDVELDGTIEAADDVDEGAVVEAVAELDDARRQLEASRLEMMRGYAEAHGCRRRYVLTYFGERFERNCGHCDNCESGRADAAERADHTGEVPFPAGTRVTHLTFGPGEVIDVEGDRITVLFDDVGYKVLSAAVAVEEGLLETG